MKMKANKTRNELKVSDSKTYRLKNEERTKNKRRTEKNDEKSSRNYSRKLLGSVTEAPWLGFSSRKHVFSPKTAEMHNIGVNNPLEQPPSSYLLKKRGGACRPARPGKLCSPQWVGGFIRKFPKTPPFLLSSPPFFRNLHKSYGSLMEAYWT